MSTDTSKDTDVLLFIQIVYHWNVIQLLS